ncbi:hypothetical protein ACFS3C_11180 [Azotobacter vinelandii]
MTFIAAVSMGDCAILAADRATFYVGAGVSIASAHLERKIAGNRHGYITAAGFVELIRPVKERFVAEASACPTEVMRIIADEQERFRRRNYLKAAVESRVKKLLMDDDPSRRGRLHPGGRIRLCERWTARSRQRRFAVQFFRPMWPTSKKTAHPIHGGWVQVRTGGGRQLSA